MPEENLDVQESETTEVDSSTDTETTQENATEESTTEAAKTEEESIPYSRFKEVNEGYKAQQERVRMLEERMAAMQQPQTPQEPANPQAEAIKEQLKALGFMTREEQQAFVQRQKEDQAVQTELSKMESKYDGKDGRPKFNRQQVIDYALKNQIGNVEVAYKAMYEKQLMDWTIKNAVTKSRGVKSEISDGSGSTNVGKSSDDLKSQIAKGDKNALHTFLKRQFTS